MRILLAMFLFISAPAYACQTEHICNNYVVCDEKNATMTRAQFTAAQDSGLLKDGYTVEWESSSNAWVIYNVNCKLKELCWDNTGACVR